LAVPKGTGSPWNEDLCGDKLKRLQFDSWLIHENNVMPYDLDLWK